LSLLLKKSFVKLAIFRGAAKLLSIALIIDEAARCRINDLHHTISKIRSTIPDDYWKCLSVIVLGPQLPREQDVAMQYFETILRIQQGLSPKCPFAKDRIKTISSNQRLIYAESIWTEKEALQLLASHIADEDLGQKILQDVESMHKDVMGPQAKKYLDELQLQKL
jgi:hypothetical protein